MTTPTPAEVIGKLAALGSPRQIADHLEQQGIRGNQLCTVSCPVARYVSHETDHATAIGPDWWRAGHAATGALPAVVAEFVWGFDAGLYPQLVRPQPRTASDGGAA